MTAFLVVVGNIVFGLLDSLAVLEVAASFIAAARIYKLLRQRERPIRTEYTGGAHPRKGV